MGRPLEKYVEVLPTGAEKVGLQPLDLEGKGGFVHALACSLAAQYYEDRGWEVYRERDGADVVAVDEQQPKIIAVEVETSITPHVAENVVRDVEEAGADRVLVAIEKRKNEKKAEEVIEARVSEYMDRVDVVTFVDFREE